MIISPGRVFCFPFILGAALVLLCTLVREASALRCSGSIVERGDRKLEVLEHCGDPLYVENWTDETVVYRVDDKGSNDLNIAFISTAYVEEWTYNFGSSRFIQFLTFIDGKLRKIEQGPKGFEGKEPEAKNRSRCGSLVSHGARKIEVLMDCGQPDVIEFFGEDRVSTILERLKADRTFKRHDVRVDVEEWTYNLGPERFLLFIKFENGRVARIEHGDYGF